MKRDFDLVRKLLFYFEGKPDITPVLRNDPPQLEGYERDQVKYHLILLYQAGLIDGEPIRSTTSDRIVDMGAVFALTWQGHEFLEKVRSDAIWEKVKQKTLSTGWSLTMQGLSAVASWFMQQALQHLAT